MATRTIDDTLQGLTAELEAAAAAYMAEMGAVKMPFFSAEAAVGVCMAHDGEFVVTKANDLGLQIDGKRYKVGDRVKLDVLQRAQLANVFAEHRLLPDYIWEARRKHDAMKDHVNQTIDGASKAVDAARAKITQGEALEVAARAQLDNAAQLQSDGKAQLETALRAAIEAYQFRPE